MQNAHPPKLQASDVGNPSEGGILIEASKVSKTYSEGVPALVQVDLTIVRGDYLAVVGPSGSGKSTLLHILGCLDRPSSGSIKIDGQPVEGLSSNQLAEIRSRKIGFVFQTFNLLRSFTLLENVELPAKFCGSQDSARCRQRALELLHSVGLDSRVNHYPKQVSVGQLQRAAIARALMNDPDLILADEPTGNLDSKTTEDIMQIFDGLNQAGKSILLITHNPEVARHAKKTLTIRDGRIVG